MKYLITGITGMSGSFLAEKIHQEQMGQVFGFVRPTSSLHNLSSILSNIHLLTVDLNNPTQVKQALSKIQPDVIFHLAAESSVSFSLFNPIHTYNTNVFPLLYLLQSCLTLKINPLIQVISSSEVYGQVNTHLPIKEDTPLTPINPYGYSKWMMEKISQFHYHHYGLRIIINRPFNHTGPRRPIRFVEASFSNQFAKMVQRKQIQSLKVGNLSTQRDYSDVRDVVRAYLLLSELGVPGETYNISSNRTHSLQEIIQLLSESTQFSPSVTIDSDLFRPNDTPPLQGDYTKLHAHTGWKPIIPFDKTILDLFTYYKELTS